ncbi:hypothetical protein OEZ85_005309 [Tetradesmus obliquus]|uniref:Cdc23 domain-containing protein n=1 Tax=Tetradesmus obliquus TaxID=3088 RepID=A0ABY8UKY6_TETOB|nr:hypothetical protein OEZ85_005309 [Tetradesmus obliquus]
MEEYLAGCIRSSLSLGLYENARFLGERLVAACASEQNKYLLATCYRHCNQGYRAVHLLQGSNSQHCRYLAALCCLDLRQYKDAEQLLLQQGESQVPAGGAGWYLLGRISRLTGSSKRAAECYVRALRLEPMLWVAFAELCMLGQPDLTAEFCEPTADGTPPGPGAFAAGHTPHMLTFVTPSPAGAPAAPPAKPHKGGLFPGFPSPPAGSRTPTLGKQKVPVGGAAAAAAAAGGAGGRGRKTSKAAGRLFANEQAAAAGAGGTPRRSARLAASHGDATPGSSSSNTPTPLGRQDPNQMQHSPAASAAPRQRQRHQQRAGSAGAAAGGAAHNEGENAPNVDAAADTAAGEGSHHWQQEQAAPLKSHQQQEQLASLLLPLRSALHLLSQYKAREALAALGQLAPAQLGSAGVLLLVGRCQYELVDYARAAEAFEAARAADPLNLEGMELYSTVLWHLKRDVELAHLAQHALAVDRMAPEAWCIAGNCFSLQREHESAVRLFQRALQLAPHMAYAATLLGHEHLAGEDLAAAATAYQHALRCDPRHYNALYGLGQIALKQEKPAEALGHFQAAARINPGSSVLRCCCGAALRKMNHLAEALRQLKCAIAIDGRNPLARYEAAGVLAALERPQEALAELTALQEALAELTPVQAIVPREPSVAFLMGRLHKRLGQPDAALRCLHAALDLRPGAADRAAIKAAIDKVCMDEDEEEEEL